MPPEHELLKSTPLFKELSDDVVARFVDIAQKRHLAAGDIVIAECTEIDEIYFILDGQVTVEAALANADQEMEIATLRPGEFIALFTYIDETSKVAPMTAIAQADTTLLVWKSAQWRELGEANLEVGYRLLMGISRILYQRLRMLNEKLLANISWGLE